MLHTQTQQKYLLVTLVLAVRTRRDRRALSWYVIKRQPTLHQARKILSMCNRHAPSSSQLSGGIINPHIRDRSSLSPSHQGAPASLQRRKSPHERDEGSARVLLTGPSNTHRGWPIKMTVQQQGVSSSLDIPPPHVSSLITLHSAHRW